MKLVRTTLAFVVAVLAVSCVTTSTGSGNTSSPLALAIKPPQVNVRRMNVDQPLHLVIASGIPEEYKYSVYNGTVTVPITNYRSAIEAALKTALSNNFQEITVGGTETDKGLEVVLLRANLQEGNSINFQAILLIDGKEAINVGAVTASRTIRLSSSAFTYVEDTRNQIVKPLTEEAIDKMTSLIYDGLFRDQDHVIDTHFWEKINGEA